MLGELLRRDRAVELTGLPRFTGGAVGFWGYDVVRTLERLPNATPLLASIDRLEHGGGIERGLLE